MEGERKMTWKGKIKLEGRGDAVAGENEEKHRRTAPQGWWEWVLKCAQTLLVCPFCLSPAQISISF